MQALALRVRALGLGLVAAAVLSACGGGGSDSPPPAPPAPTVIPENLAITAPGTAESATAVAFTNSAGALSGLKYQWDFGDGATSTEAAPSHSFAAGGEFDVVLKVTNEAGSSREVRTKVSITNIANVRGLDCTGASSTGWCWQNPRPTGNHVNTVYFLNATTGWRGGENGEIFKTTDGGTTWVRQNSGVNAAIYGIKFFDAQTGWATGAFGAVLRTTDGGATWAVAKFADTPYYLNGSDLANITPVDAKTVYVGRTGGFSGLIYGSKDGGLTWRTITPSPNQITASGKFWALQSNSVRVSADGGASYTGVLDFKTPSTSSYFDITSMLVQDDQHVAAYTRASGYDFSAQKWVYTETLYFTADGGANWSKVDIPTGASATGIQQLTSVSADGKVLVASSYNGMLRSTDGGLTWSALPGPSTDPYAYYVSYIPLGGSDVIASSYAALWLSRDSGQTWTKLGMPGGVSSLSVSSDSIRRIDANSLLASDGQGSMHVSKDNGQTWVKVFTAVDNGGYFGQTSVLGFADAKSGFMTDSIGKSFATKDGGITWEAKSVGFSGARTVQFINKTGWLVGNDGRLYTSNDLGQSWTNVPTAVGVSLTGAYFQSETLGWSQRNSGAQFAITRDGGKTWTETALPSGVMSIRFGDPSWVAVGYGGAVYVSTDSGATWNAVYTGTTSTLNALAFTDAKTVWAVGSEGTVLKSNDGGAKWAAVNLPTGNSALRDIKFANAKVGWIVGDNGLILTTQDGGKTWRKQPSGTNLSLGGIQIVDVNTAWITGANGLVLATGNGGN
ncbi:MAG TPA: YCF48-related protein [Roseateles sp.]